jgi:ubiquinone/menaquinone biosynthesis C-methylase UbiE
MSLKRSGKRECRHRGGSKEDGPGGSRPYSELALIYDELVGDTAFDCWRENFEQLRARLGFDFDVAVDVACGTGHAAFYLAGICRKVYAVDISSEMLEVARGKSNVDNVVFLEQSFTGFELPERVDLLTCNFDSLNYLLAYEDVVETLDRFARSLKQGGWCVFDMNTTRELEVECGNSVLVHRVSRGMAVWESDWDPQERVNTLRMTNFLRERGGLYRMSEETHRERSYDTGFIVGALEASGFSLIQAYDARDLTGVTEKTRRVQFVARR